MIKIKTVCDSCSKTIEEIALNLSGISEPFVRGVLGNGTVVLRSICLACRFSNVAEKTGADIHIV